jgi:small GTP-binding protein
MTTAQKIADIEVEMARTQKNKATEGHLALLKTKLAKLKRELIEPAKGQAGAGDGFDVKASGDARVGLIGFPSVGKSTLLTKLTGCYSEAADYEFTTLTCIPGVFNYKGTKIQLLDLPGIIEGAKDGKGRGKQVIGVARTCSLILIVLDVMKPLTHKRIIEKELEGFGIRLNRAKPQITLKKKDKGGVNITKSMNLEMTKMTDDTIRSILHEYKISNCDVNFKSNATMDELIDVIEGNRIYVPCIYVMNKIDQISIEELDLVAKVPHYVPISARDEWNFDELMEKIWEYLDLIRIYTKPKGQIPDYDAPVILPRNHSSVQDFCLKLHKTLIKEFKVATIWGTSVKFNPQRCGKDHQLQDEDVVQIIKKK